MKVPIAKPFIGKEETDAVVKVLASGQLAQGPAVAEFERLFAAYHGARHGIAVSNGTTALTAALMAHDIGRDDEVIVPSFTFFATASSVLSVGARPVFADIDPRTFCLDPDSVKSKLTKRTRAIMPVHLYGQPADMGAFEQLCTSHGLILIEDSAQAHGASIGERRVGTWGTAAFSFYPTKNMTTTEGGMVLTNDDEIARRLRVIRNQGMNQQYHHERLGYNLRMTDLCAAIGIVQLGRLPDWTGQRIANAAFYNANLRGITTPHVRAGCTPVYHQYTVRVRDARDRDEICARLNDRGVGVRVYYPTPIHRQPVFVQMQGYENLGLTETDAAAGAVFSLPVHPLLTPAERQYVADEVNGVVEDVNKKRGNHPC
jgi:dTDP-4-amino-4,6-dideoxygalactose transaminase